MQHPHSVIANELLGILVDSRTITDLRRRDKHFDYYYTTGIYFKEEGKSSKVAGHNRKSPCYNHSNFDINNHNLSCPTETDTVTTTVGLPGTTETDTLTSTVTIPGTTGTDTVTTTIDLPGATVTATQSATSTITITATTTQSGTTCAATPGDGITQTTTVTVSSEGATTMTLTQTVTLPATTVSNAATLTEATSVAMSWFTLTVPGSTVTETTTSTKITTQTVTSWINRYRHNHVNEDFDLDTYKSRSDSYGYNACNGRFYPDHQSDSNDDGHQDRGLAWENRGRFKDDYPTWNDNSQLESCDAHGSRNNFTLPGSIFTTIETIPTTLSGSIIVTTTTKPGQTITMSGSVTTLPGSTIIQSSTLPSVTTTDLQVIPTTLPGAMILTTVMRPASTMIVSGTITTLPGSTIVQSATLPGLRLVETVSVTVIQSTTIFDTVTLTGFDKAITTTEPAASTAQSGNTVTVPATTTTLFICPTLSINPTYTPVAPLPRNYTWGCPPGYLCKTKHTGADAGCNIEASMPAESYVCSPDECIKSSPFIHDQYWGTPVESSEIRSSYNISKDYFNLDPEIFGLNYSIFRIPDLKPGDDHYYIRSSRRTWSKLLARQSIGVSTVPGACYDECNDAALEVESTGKTPDICNAGSAFNVSLGQCEKCCNTHKTATSASFEQKVLPNFQQFLNFCEGLEDSATTAAADTVGSTTKGSQTSTTPGTTSTQEGGTMSQADPLTASSTSNFTGKATKTDNRTAPNDGIEACNRE
ncbi:hypothetical protein KXX11_007797 [Aspergillus fumigatus]|nr:hypothetical protein KXX11_007797 [Aspergillus fumigatus]